MESSRSERKTLKQKVMGGPVLHVANIQDEAGVSGLKAIERYKLRSMAALDPGDVSVLPANIRESALDMFRLYDQLGVPHINPEDILYLDYDSSMRLSQALLVCRAEVLAFLQRAGAGVDRFIPFIHSADSDAIARALDLRVDTNAKSSEFVNDKGLSQRELAQLGVDTPMGKVVRSLDEALDFCRELQDAGFREVMFKITRSASGMGVFQIPFEKVPEYMEQYADEVAARGVLLDGYIPGKLASPNIQFNIGDTENDDQFISCSEQILSDDDVHLGNVNDPNLYFKSPRVQENVLKTRNWIREQGYRGIVGIDLYITQDGKPYYMETNGRFNGSTPGALLADKLHGTSVHVPWGVQNNISLSRGTTVNDFVAGLERDHLLYDPDTRYGVLPTNTSAIESHQKAMVTIFAETSERVQEILGALYALNPEVAEKCA